jgi:hypothetical protein
MGVTLCNPHNLDEAGSLGRAVLIERAAVLAKEIAPVLRSVRLEGATTLRSIAHALNRRGISKRGTSRALMDWLAGAIESPADSTLDF